MSRTRGGGGVWFSRKTIDCCQTEGYQSPIFNGVKQPVEQISNDLPIYVLVNDVRPFRALLTGLIGQQRIWLAVRVTLTLFGSICRKEKRHTQP